MLGFCIVVNNIQPVLSGVAVGAGWQAFVAYVNVGCYYLFGIPLGLLMGFALHWGVLGIWSGMIGGTIIQTLILTWMVYGTNWNEELRVEEN
ncbi:protein DETOXIFICATION 31-like [Cucumis melo]|uniref:Protein DETOXIFICATION 31-like n=1 Tax=Cucumis melo TaxID=3656 RepID=A0ABM3KD47_CUCME|nr:protein DETOXIFICATION 31-like [Cucumis melo]